MPTMVHTQMIANIDELTQNEAIVYSGRTSASAASTMSTNSTINALEHILLMR